MLIEFSVENFRSFRDAYKLSMVATPDKESEDHTAPLLNTNIKILKSASIYGANGSGKSNIVKAISTMKNIILSSSFGQRGDKLYGIQPFVFDNEHKKQPTTFEIIFATGGIRYQYGFSATSEKVMEEWLYSFSKKKSKKNIFYRSLDLKKKQYEWEYDIDSLDASNAKISLYKETTRSNELFLSKIIQLNNQAIAPVFDWFLNKLQFAGIGGYPDDFATGGDYAREKNNITIYMLKNHKRSIINMLHDMDIVVDDIEITEKDDTALRKILNTRMQSLPDSFFKRFKKDFIRKIDGVDVRLDISEESDGTQKVFYLLGPFINALEKGLTVIIDELHSGLHPLLTRYLIGLFNNNTINKRNAQLIFTTHEVEILDQKFLRRDQVWFCDKREDFSTSLTPLTDYKPRISEKLSKGYMLGRYGGIPYIEEQIKEHIIKRFNK